jgi:hypothetical protein
VPDPLLLTWKFGYKRNEKSWPVTIKADPDTGALQSDQLEIIASPLTRADNSEELPAPTFTAPRISADRARIFLRICVSAKGGAPGSYSGSVSIGGPPGVSATNASINVTLKEQRSIFLGLEFIAGLVALAALAIKGTADYQKEKFEGVETNKQPPWNWFHAFTYNWRTVPGAVTSIFGLIAALGGAYLLYHKGEAWGADLTADGIAALQGALTAVGIQGGLSGVIAAFKGP